jgi:CSLREA domain-containing protein
VLFALALVAASAQAGVTTFVVNSNGDAGDANPGDAVCATGGSVCTLRAAIEESNALGGGAHVNFAPTVTGQILLGSELPPITGPITIEGPGASQLAVDGANTYRVLESQFAASTTISGLTIRNGREGIGTTLAGGGIYAGADMTLDRVVVTQNTADAGTDAYGGGIAVGGGTLTLRRSTLSGNTATTSGTLATNVHAYGGGIAVFNGGMLVVDHSTISGNTAHGVIVTPSSGSNASGHGGGVYAGDDVQIDQSTISGNTASGSGGDSNIGGGGGYYEDNNGALTLTGSTISDNTVVGSGVFTDGANVDLIPQPGATVKSSIIANPIGGSNCISNGTPLVSNGYNLDEDGSCDFNQTTDLTGDPMLGPLADNGGPTQTEKVLAGSAVIDRGKSFGATTDQRGFGFPRISDSPTITNAVGGDGADIGAYERDVVAKKPIFTGSTPKSPANNSHPKLRGLAEAGSHVRIYKGSCTGTPVATGSAAMFKSPGIAVSVPNNTSTAFRAQITDATGNISACSNAFTYVEDSQPPNTTISSATVSRADHRATFAFSSTETGSKFECRLDSQPFGSCTSPRTYTGLAAGSHSFRVRAVDRAGNADPTPASRAFTI